LLPCKTYGHDGEQFLSEDPPGERPAPGLFSSTSSRSLCRPRPCSDDGLVGGGGGGALLVESPAEAGGCSPGNARAAARLAEPDVTTMRANSMVATTAAFLIMDSEELLLLLFPELYVLDFSFGSDSIAATKSHDLDSSRLL